MKNLLFLAFIISCIASCGEATPTTTETTTTQAETVAPAEPKLPMIEQLETAHHVTDFHKKEVLAFDIKLTWGGNPVLDGTISATTNSTRVRLDKSDKTSVIYDGKEVYFTPDTADATGARFAIFTWQYFVMAPFKFSDPGTNWEDLGEMNLVPGQLRQAAKLTFGENIGDAPEDWYIAFRQPETNLTDGMAYIVTGGTRSQEEAEQVISAVTYHDYQMIEGIPMPQQMKFWYYDMETGLKDQKGEATVSNVRFLARAAADFNVPENSKPIGL